MPWTETFEIWRDVMIPFREFLDIYEREVMTFIWARTRMFDKDWEQISINQFMRGIVGERYRLAPVDMTKEKLHECMRHLKAKRFIEVQETGMTTGNRYRIRWETELDIEHIRTYVRRHQPKLYQRMGARMAQTPFIKAIMRNQTREELRPTLGRNSDLPLGRNTDLYNIPNDNRPSLNKRAEPAKRRVVIPRKT